MSSTKPKRMRESLTVRLNVIAGVVIALLAALESPHAAVIAQLVPDAWRSPLLAVVGLITTAGNIYVRVICTKAPIERRQRRASRV